MPPTTSCSFGDVVLVPFPFTDQSSTKKRPAVVVSSDAYHRDHVDLIVAAVTSQPQSHRSGEVALADWQQAGLLKPSVVKPVLATIEARLVLKKLGRLSDNDCNALARALHHVLGS